MYLVIEMCICNNGILRTGVPTVAGYTSENHRMVTFVQF